MVRNDILSNNRRTIKSECCKDVVVNILRGGSSDGVGNNNDDDNNQINNSMSATPYQEQQQPPLQAPTPHETTTSTGVGGEFMDVMSSNNDPMYGYRETVEDRIDAWRKQQQHMQQTQSPPMPHRLLMNRVDSNSLQLCQKFQCLSSSLSLCGGLCIIMSWPILPLDQVERERVVVDSELLWCEQSF